MSNLSPETIEWASKALSDGRSLEFVASVMEVRPKRAQTIIDVHQRKRAPVDVDGPHVWRASENDVSAARARAERVFSGEQDAADEPTTRRPGRPKAPEAGADSTLRERRKFLLAARFARHWDMIWYCLGRGMRGRTVRSIYGAECLIWARGGGINVEVE